MVMEAWRNLIDYLEMQEYVSKQQALSAGAGALIAMLVSFVVNCALVEVTLNGIFALYFGVLFLLISGVVVYRVRSGEHPHPHMLLAFSLVMGLSGLVCLLFETTWLYALSSTVKVPLYVSLGVSVSYALMFSLIDLLNFLVGYLPSYANNAALSRPVVEGDKQV